MPNHKLYKNVSLGKIRFGCSVDYDVADKCYSDSIR
jgi:hypothetical protein